MGRPRCVSVSVRLRDALKIIIKLNPQAVADVRHNYRPVGQYTQSKRNGFSYFLLLAGSFSEAFGTHRSYRQRRTKVAYNFRLVSSKINAHFAVQLDLKSQICRLAFIFDREMEHGNETNRTDT